MARVALSYSFVVKAVSFFLSLTGKAASQPFRSLWLPGPLNLKVGRISEKYLCVGDLGPTVNLMHQLISPQAFRRERSEV